MADMPDIAVGTESRPLRVAVLGSGPSGFYAAEELLTQKDVKATVDVLDRLPTPYGLVRGGVAPDHQKIKTVTLFYEKTAARPGFRYFGNVEYGKDMTLEELRRLYDAVIFAVGAKSDNKMGIPGEDLQGSEAATVLVGWYNGHPDYKDYRFDLSEQTVAVVGNGNVAMDVVRILGQDPEELAPTDIADYAVQVLRKSRIREIYLLGRRGPAQAAFTNPEIQELCELKGCDLVVDPKEVELDPVSAESLAKGEGGGKAKKNVEILTAQSKKGPGSQPRRIIVRNLVSPVEIQGKDGRVAALKLEKNTLVRAEDGSIKAKGTGQFEVLPVGLVFRSVGYKGVALPGLPYDARKGTIPNVFGRVQDPQSKAFLPWVYVVGWAKRGPSGVIGTNKPDSVETVKKLLEDFKGKAVPAGDERTPDAAAAALAQKGIKLVSFADWKRLDKLEVENGKRKGKIRDKYTTVPDMLKALDSAAVPS